MFSVYAPNIINDSGRTLLGVVCAESAEEAANTYRDVSPYCWAETGDADRVYFVNVILWNGNTTNVSYVSKASAVAWARYYVGRHGASKAVVMQPHARQRICTVTADGIIWG